MSDYSIYEIPQSEDARADAEREKALMVASGLAWAVAKLEGLAEDTGYAGEVFDWWRYPQRLVIPEAKSDSDEAPSP